MRDDADIVRTYRDRRNRRAPLMRAAERMQAAVNGDLVLATSERAGGREEQAAVANLARQAVNQYAVRAGSTLPTLLVPPSRPGIKRSEDQADLRRRGLIGWWELNDLKLKLYRRLRHFAGYGSSPVVIRPDFVRGVPSWQVRNPLSTYPAPSSDADDMCPRDVIFSFERTLAWIQYRYPEAYARLDKGTAPKPDDRYTLLEYIDDESLAMVVLGRDESTTSAWQPAADPGASRGAKFVEVERTPNRAGRCLAVMPGRITLDKPQGQFDGMLAIFIKRARLSALEEIAIEKGVFENEWFEHDGSGEIVTYANGRDGTVGEVRGGKMAWHSLNPGYKTDQMLDRLERQERIEAPLPAEMGAESASNVRTDRRGNTILSVSVDFTIGETHDVFAASARNELEIGVDVSKGFFGNAPTSFYVNWKGATGPVTYKPTELFDTPVQVLVRWPMPGADVNSLTVGGEQRVGAGTLSRRGFMEIDPLVDNPEQEHDRIIAEQLEQLMMTTLQAQPPPPADLAAISEAVITNKMELFEAVQDAQRKAQERQATPAPAGSPETQPGLAPPGAGAEQPTIAPTVDQQGLAALNATLRRGGQPVPVPAAPAA